MDKSAFLPDQVDFVQFAQQRRMMHGLVPLQSLSRALTLLSVCDGNVSAQCQFGVDSQGYFFACGSLEATVTLVCQRCMMPYTHRVAADFCVAKMKGDEADFPQCYEQVTLDAGKLSLHALLEDELILSLPIVPKHDVDECSVSIQPVEAKSDSEKAVNPFDVLKQLKR